MLETLSSCCISFCLLGKILLVTRIQTAFARRKRSGYARLGKVDFHCPVCAAKKNLSAHILSGKHCSQRGHFLMPHAFAFRLFFPKRKAFADIHRNISLVRSVTIRQRRISNCNKPVITCPLGRLANLSPLGMKRPRVIN